MLTGLTGSLLSNHYAERLLQLEFSGELGEPLTVGARTALERWWSREAVQLGPASSLRTIWNVSVVPLAELLGFSVETAPHTTEDIRWAALRASAVRLGLVAGHWTLSLDSLWRTAVRQSAEMRTNWSICTNGRQLRLIDTERCYSRAFVEFDLQAVVESSMTFQVFWAVLRADAFRDAEGRPALISRIVDASARHGHAVGRSLRAGVIAAVEHLLTGLSRCARRDLAMVFDDALTIVYRALFLMFAEARGLVPNWHPLYKESYTIEALRNRVDRPEPCPGLWEALQAIARLAHRGCQAGTLVVPPFNGRLFSPARAPLAEACLIEDEHARKALTRLSVTTIKSRQSRIDYRDLGVEHLGAVYESILDYTPERASDGFIVLQRGGGQRKTTGSFYTPQPLTDFLVRRTLHPLVAGASPDRILALRVVDPAMGSGAFLVSACRYLAEAYERALIREGTCQEADVDQNDRAAFRRQIAQRCLFGVDVNPTAVYLACLSLWLATLAANKPLSFLDHRLVSGNSLLGASPADVARQPPTRNTRRRRQSATPLFADTDLEASLAQAVDERCWLAETGDDTAEIVREKERRLSAVRRTVRWKAVADLWCACWMWPAGSAPPAGVFADIVDAATSGRSALPSSMTDALIEQAQRIAQERRFFHWELEFPEIYFDAQGQVLPNPGFDAVLGNPPWDVISAASGERAFLREAGIYRHLGSGHINRYQVFVERALMLTKPGGRIGLVLPSGFATDHTAAALRRRLMAIADVDAITAFDNRKAIFPIHRSVRFMTCTATKGRPTSEIACRFGIDDARVLESIPDGEDLKRASHPITLTPALLSAVSGDSLSIPELRTSRDVHILDRIVRRMPRLGDEDGWNVRFGRELNATEDRPHFHRRPGGLPVIEGKHVEPFRVQVEQAKAYVSRKMALSLLDGPRTFMRRRLAYRDVASSTNRLSLIAAILPAGVVTTHTLFCLKTLVSNDEQLFLCGIFNSFIANYLVRLMMTTHLGSATVECLRVPKPSADSRLFTDTVSVVHALLGGGTLDDYARLQALAAACYNLTLDDFTHVLGTFPLIARSERDRAMEEFARLTRRENGESA